MRNARRSGRTYVLIHGAWHGGWVWAPVVEGLHAKGHAVYAPSLTGLGDRRHLLRPGINLDTHAEDIVSLIQMEGLSKVVLVGWSYGGMIVSEVLAQIPERVASVVYLDAFAPERGRSLLSYSQRTIAIDQAVQDALEGRDIPPLSLEWMGVTDSAIIDYVTPRLSLHPVMTYLQTSKALPERPDIPHTYVLATRSPIQAFRPFFDLFEKDSRAQTYTLDHLLMLTASDKTLKILSEIN
jgi:pimeloyl-ACP methyl ester carboxylesterase